MVECLIAFGSNLGDSTAAYRNVTDWLHQSANTHVIACSKLIRTLPVGGPDRQDPFLNGAVRIQTALTSGELHRLLIQFEKNLGRIDRERWGARTVDLDLLLYGEHVVNEQNLIIPHPRMSFRRFVLEPASEIAGDCLHPDSGLSITELLERINQETNHLVWIAPHQKDFVKARAVLVDCHEDLKAWHCEIADVSSYHEKLTPKLVIQELERPFLLRAPTLLVAGYTDQEKRVELRAAVKAVGKF